VDKTQAQSKAIHASLDKDDSSEWVNRFHSGGSHLSKARDDLYFTYKEGHKTQKAKTLKGALAHQTRMNNKYTTIGKAFYGN
jgi:hypothetical protein